ncbi:MAG: ribonuclease HI [Candidatus Cloacimonetes bacterium]|nr:ribonuclease HI [Candidatus Cloacimonadota bacterium]
MKQVIIYCDGACKRNPGPGGWAAILKYKKYKKRISGYSPKATSNIMEMTAAIKALEQLKKKCKVDIFTDSRYMKNGITKWIKNWKKTGWKTSKKEPVKNKELWVQLDELCSRHIVNWFWIKGHSGNPDNEECDMLANNEIKKNVLNIQKNGLSRTN